MPDNAAIRIKNMSSANKLADILLVEDNEGDIELTREAFEDARLRNTLHIAEDGGKALDFLFKRNGLEDSPTPDIILLDLNLPRVSGRDVLHAIKNDENLRRIPTIVLTSSESDRDVFESYDLQANCYIVKPVDAIKFMDVVQQVENFWVDIVCLPSVE
ncbi:response regulator receiver protein [Litorimonas taeanensis]|uniref:Response regulator receiver protein n=2 Tax=Litorimonas taeanensis TaxID=568099 RepID=A0A420WEK3_9PROT|nr:response regulator receiver protein [Litorimonas taeanensis]